MKKATPILLSLLVLLQSLAGTLLVVQYQAQKNYIASQLCENRATPSKGCQGKCYLKKQLKKAEEAEKSVHGNIKEKMEVVYVLQEPLCFPPSENFTSEAPLTSYSFSFPEVPVLGSLQPPQA